MRLRPPMLRSPATPHFSTQVRFASLGRVAVAALVPLEFSADVHPDRPSALTRNGRDDLPMSSLQPSDRRGCELLLELRRPAEHVDRDDGARLDAGGSAA